MNISLYKLIFDSTLLHIHACSIAVAASDINDTRASFSDYGTCVDLIAPVSYNGYMHTSTQLALLLLTTSLL